MRKMVLRLDCGPGMDSAEFFLVPTDTADDQLADYAWQRAIDHAQMYGMSPPPLFFSDQESDEEEDEEEYSTDVEGWFETYNPEEHDGLRTKSDDSWQDF